MLLFGVCFVLYADTLTPKKFPSTKPVHAVPMKQMYAFNHVLIRAKSIKFVIQLEKN